MPTLWIMLVALLMSAAAGVQAHVNDRGMDYRLFKDTAGIPCCSNKDCQPAEHFIETAEGGREVVRLLIDGVWITVPRGFLAPKQATDGRAHWCGMKLHSGDYGAWRPGTRCIILPPRLL
jgi:hypothetical protein